CERVAARALAAGAGARAGGRGGRPDRRSLQRGGDCVALQSWASMKAGMRLGKSSPRRRGHPEGRSATSRRMSLFRWHSRKETRDVPRRTSSLFCFALTRLRSALHRIGTSLANTPSPAGRRAAHLVPSHLKCLIALWQAGRLSSSGPSTHQAEERLVLPASTLERSPL